MRPRTAGVLAVCVAATLWGLDGVALTPRLYTLSIPLVVFLLHAVPFILMQPLLGRSYAALARLSPRGWLSLVLVALTGGLVGTLAIVKALFLVHFSQLSVVILLQKLQPVFAILLASIILKERITPKFVAWAGVALAGAYILAFGFGAPDFGASAEAAFYAVLAAAAFGAATVFGKQLLGELSFTDATFGRFGVTAGLALLYLVLAGVGVPLGLVTPANWLVILIIAVTTGGGAIVLYYWGLRRITASVSTVCELCLPLSAVLFDYLINGSVLRPFQWLGAGVLLAAIIRIAFLQAHEGSRGLRGASRRGARHARV